jgi:DNA-binding CsgD family transcriptional regulator
VRVAHDSGGLSLLPLALDERAKVELAFGDRTAAQAVISQAETTIETNRSRFTLLSPAVLAAWQGPGGEALRLIPSVWSRATLLNGVGRWEEALAASQSVAQQPDQLPASTWACAELVEAAARSGSMYVTDGPLERLAEFAHASGSAWALGIEARSRALVNGGVEAERLYGRAIDHLSRTRIKVDLARAHLVYGEWLRREGRRVDAREHLRTAYDLLSGLGADGFAARARRELLATGETVRKRIESTRGDLTAQEAEIARLAAQGRTNPEIGACLFISPRTVQYHLRKVFRKLDVRSRNELRAALPADIAIPRAVAA